MNVEKLIASTIAQTGANIRIKLSAEDLTQTTAATAQVIPLFTASAGSLVELVAVHATESFADADDSALNSTALTVGSSAAATGLLASTQLNANASAFVTTAVGAGAMAVSADTVINATFAAVTGKSLANIDTGNIILLFRLIDLSQFVG